jgi:hypothetical protein
MPTALKEPFNFGWGVSFYLMVLNFEILKINSFYNNWYYRIFSVKSVSKYCNKYNYKSGIFMTLTFFLKKILKKKKFNLVMNSIGHN